MEVLVFSMVDMRRAKASATRLPELPGSSLAVVSSYSSGSTPETETRGNVNEAETPAQVQQNDDKHLNQQQHRVTVHTATTDP